MSWAELSWSEILLGRVVLSELSLGRVVLHLLRDDGRLSTLLKCSAHLFKIASLSVRSVLPSALSSGVAPELFVP